jgi:magnesium transporter
MGEDAGAVTASELREAWPALSTGERLEGFVLLDRRQAEDLFVSIPARDQSELLLAHPPEGRRLWLRLLAPDDIADVVQAAPAAEREGLLAQLDAPTRVEVSALLAYAEDVAGGLMSPRFARLRPGMTVEEALRYLRRQGQAQLETAPYLYVLDAGQVLQGVLSLRELFMAPPGRLVAEVMRRQLVTAPTDLDQEQLSLLFAQHDLLAIPVCDGGGRLQGVVTLDDIVDVVREEATEDIQKIGGTEALDQPYLSIPLLRMVKKRGGWLAALFLGEMLTATAMGHYEHEIARAVVLALFVPLIISSGGNSGSQATTLVIRALALRELRLVDWWRVARREVASGLLLGLTLGTIGLLRILIWQGLFHTYGQHYLVVGLTVAASLVGVVTFGSLTGAMLPFLLRKSGFDPASASAPFVATLVDVSGLIIYFSVASLILRGTLLP